MAVANDANDEQDSCSLVPRPFSAHGRPREKKNYSLLSRLAERIFVLFITAPMRSLMLMWVGLVLDH